MHAHVSLIGSTPSQVPSNGVAQLHGKENTSLKSISYRHIPATVNTRMALKVANLATAIVEFGSDFAGLLPPTVRPRSPVVEALQANLGTCLWRLWKASG